MEASEKRRLAIYNRFGESSEFNQRCRLPQNAVGRAGRDQSSVSALSNPTGCVG